MHEEKSTSGSRCAQSRVWCSSSTAANCARKLCACLWTCSCVDDMRFVGPARCAWYERAQSDKRCGMQPELFLKTTSGRCGEQSCAMHLPFLQARHDAHGAGGRQPCVKGPRRTLADQNWRAGVLQPPAAYESCRARTRQDATPRRVCCMAINTTRITPHIGTITLLCAATSYVLKYHKPQNGTDVGGEYAQCHRRQGCAAGSAVEPSLQPPGQTAAPVCTRTRSRERKPTLR
jgi:hypothetical protein